MLINRTSTALTVKIVTADGRKDSINLQPNSRARPPAGATIDPVAFSSYQGQLLGIESYAPTVSTGS